MNAWRSFASDFVNHTYDDFRKKYDKLYSSNPQQKATATKGKFDIKNLFPYKLSSEDLETRLHHFVQLQQKVGKQRSQIKKRDQSYESKKQEKLELLKKEADNGKIEKKNQMMRIRSMGMNRSYREASQEMRETCDGVTFMLTTTEGITERLNVSRARFPVLTPKNNRNSYFK